MIGMAPPIVTFALSLPFLGALAAPLFVRWFGARAGLVLALFPLASFAILVPLAGPVARGTVYLAGFDWVPAYGIRLSARLDGLSLVFALLVTGIGVPIVAYAGAYLKGHRDLGRFLGFLLLFMGSMLGLVVSDDLVALFVLWEMTSISSFLLIGFDHERVAARRAALQALVVTGGGGLALLAGLLLLREGLGLASLTAVLEAGEAVRASALYLPILLLVLAGAFTKSAQVPFHVWLPNAMEAPTPVSAYLHSATMVKAGIYLLMRLSPALGATPAWTTILPLFGAATLLTGALLAVRARDVKIVLAYTTVASLGLLVLLIGIGGEAGIAAAVLYLLAHCFFKGGLFMVAGSIDHGAGTRDLGQLGGLRRAMPFTFAAALLCALSMAGVTPFLGFLAKEEIYHALQTPSLFGLLLLAAAFAGNALMVTAACLVALKPFLGERPKALGSAHEGAAPLYAGPLALGIAGLLAGLLSSIAHLFLSTPMASAVVGVPARVEIGALPHLNLAFALSMATLAAGLLGYRFAPALRRGVDTVTRAAGWGPDRGFDQALSGLVLGAAALTRRLQSGRLDHYMTATFAVILAALFAPMLLSGSLPAMPAVPDLRLVEGTVLALILLGIVAVVVARNRLTAIVSLGIQGFAVALLYLLAGAPDLSFTQFMIETLSVVILALTMTRLKLYPTDHRPFAQKLPDAALAAGVGAGFGLVLLSVVQRPFDPLLSDFFGRWSYEIAHGRNIVNVIIVDFRGLDTMGEIAVVMTTGLAILALMRLRVAPKPARPIDPQEATG
ncbi:cation:proton antiporter [Aurantimonas sp. Leaf443]|nr:cation:proton antiporter [Aurantimonas sp. Leaf443]